MKSNYDIIKRPIITEKSSGLVDKLQYTFEVAVDANKVEIKNVNSFGGVRDAINYEIQRQIELKETGKYDESRSEERFA